MKNFSAELGGLANPLAYCENIDVKHHSAKCLLSLLRQMITIRTTEALIGDWVEERQAKCPCHLGIGQEAIAVGVASELYKTDYVFGTHRAHPHFLAMGGSVYRLLAEVLGKKTGCAKGIGGSQHLIDQKNGFYGSVPIVGGTVSLAVGAALAAKMNRSNNVAVCFFGDGAIEEGVVQESLNLASTHQLPVLFVCENNLYSSHLDIKLRQPCDRVSRFAKAHKISYHTIDGNDVIAVKEAAADLLNPMRNDTKPGFIEAITYRWRGHVGPKENIDVGIRRKSEDLAAWKKRDPIKRLADTMITRNYLNKDSYNTLLIEIKTYIEAMKLRALSDPYPETESLCDNVYYMEA